MTQKTPILIQVSIPFCFHPCAYCDFPYCAYDPAVLRAYASALQKDIAAASDDMEEFEVQAISIEGGCPSLLGADALAQVLYQIRKRFSISDQVQISLQTMPGEYSRALMEKMRDAGVNHWIIGLVTAQQAEHDLLERPYKFDAITMVNQAIRTFHPRDISFDLLYGIPGQTTHSLTQTLKRVLTYDPDHLTLRPLEFRPNTRLTSKYESNTNRESLVQVSPTEQAEQKNAAQQLLAQHGLSPYTGIDFAKPGKENRFRLGQLHGLQQLGIGYRATSILDGMIWSTGHSLQEYLDHPDEIEILANHVRRISSDD